MCGIVGRVNFRSQAPIDPAVLQHMCDLIAHRGPDSQGMFLDGPVGLGHLRLAIIDLSPAGHQPMAYADGRLQIVFNGEVYNFQELRAELETRGHRFRTRSDTEVILAAYQEHGVGCLEKLRGMFAFAIWDAAERSLFVARDRVGKKPLHYRLDADGIAFASEPKAFLAEPGFTVAPDLTALSHYLTFQYVPSPYSAFQGVQKLSPGHYLLVKDGQVAIERYWQLRYGPKLRLSEAEAAEELLARLREAVRLRLISDVPLGAFLSGGIDSGTIVALMAEQSGAPVKTFSIGFEQKDYDERAYARLVARRYETDHHEFVVKPDAVAIVPRLVWHYNEPYADSSAIPTYYLAQLTRQYVTVALNGDGGDENFAGYDRYWAMLLAQRAGLIPRPARRALGGLIGLVPGTQRPRSLLSRGRRFLQALDEPWEYRYAHFIGHFSRTLKAELCTVEFRQAAGAALSEDLLLAHQRQSDAANLVDGALAMDVASYLPDDLLVKVDIATMAHALEGRSPLLDHELMEFCARLPADYKLRGRVKKYLFKRVAAPLLPPAILRRPKMGFGVPLDHWFRQDLREFAHDLLLSGPALNRGYFRRAVVERLLAEHVRGERNWQYHLWNLVMLELWHRLFVDERRSRSPGTPPPGTSWVVLRESGGLLAKAK